MRRFRLRPAALLLAALCGGGALWAASVPAPRAPAEPQRIVSLNLCADLLLLLLADRDQIAGLTINAADPRMSAEAARATGLPIIRDSAEQILAIQPDLVFGSPIRRTAAIEALGKRYRSIDLPFAESHAQIIESIRTVARAVGHPGRGEALVAQMDRKLAAIPSPGRGRVAAYYQRGGYLTGQGTLVDELMRRAGLVNLAALLHKPPLSRLSLEELVAARPDFLIVESSGGLTDQGSEMLDHPVLRHIPRLRLPRAATVCGGPSYVDAARALAEQLGG